MENKNANIFVSSVAKVSERLKYYGDANLQNISLLRLIYKYACYATSYAQLQTLDKMVSKLQREDSLICLEHQSSGVVSYSSPVGVITVGETNARPTLSATSITVGEEVDIYTFTYADLFSGYSDDGGGSPSSFVISQLPSSGNLLYDGVQIVAGELLYDIAKVTYQRNGVDAYSSSFDYYAYDDNNQLPLASLEVTCSITVEAVLVENEPPTIEDVLLSSENRVITVFRSSSFSSYSDIDGDNLGAIQIISIATTNTGRYMYLGAPVIVGQIITVEQMDVSTEAFYHEGPDTNSASSDTIEIAVRAKTGDTSWVE